MSGCRGPGRRRVLTVAMALAVAVSALVPARHAAAEDDAPVTPPPPAARCTRLGVIGDSLTLHSRRPLASGLVARGITSFRIDAGASRRIPVTAPAPYSGVKALRAMRAAGYQMDCYLVALGTNDIGLTSNVTVYGGWARQLLTEIGAHPVVWVTVARLKLPAQAERFNQVLRSLAAEFPNLVLADWVTAMVGHDPYVAPDGVHLTKAGREFRGEWMAAAAFDTLFGVAPDAPAAECTVTRTLRRKMVGDDVVCLEHRLVQLGYALPDEPDDIFDTGTAKAIADWQRYAGLAVSGIVTPKTATALGLRPAS